MSHMFDGCSSLIELNLNNFNTNNVTNMSHMFYGCSDDLKMKIKSENKNIKDEAFIGDYETSLYFSSLIVFSFLFNI